MLLSGDAQVRGDAEDGHYVVWEDDLAAVVGRPGTDVLCAALAEADAVRDLLVARDALDDVARALSGWSFEQAAIHALPEAAPEWPRPGPDVHFLGREDSLAHLEVDLAEEIAGARERTRVAAAWCDGRPVAFCYASSLTETLWDVSIDTAPAYRRRGFARSAVHGMAAFQARHQRRPVWGALVGNRPSMELAACLGFVPVDTLYVFSRRP